MTVETDQAKEDAENIAKRLREMQKEQGTEHTTQAFTKASIRSHWDLPNVRAVKVWFFLTKLGFVNDEKRIIAQPTQASIDQKKREEEAERKREAAERKKEEEEYKREQELERKKKVDSIRGIGK